MNWLDMTLLVIIAFTVVLGLIKGLAKQVIGLVAVVAGLVLAALYCREAAGIFGAVMDNELLARFLGFLLIFFLVLTAGSILGYLVTKAMAGPLALANRLFGGAFGLVKGVLIAGVLVFALVTFKVAEPALETSVVAPACLGIARAAVNLIPQDIRAEFNESYKAIREKGGSRGQKI